MQRLCTAASVPEAYLLRDRLAAAGIEARVFNENAIGAVGELPFTHAWPEIWLHDPRDRERALAIVREHESAEPVSGSRRCENCTEDNPANFELCWSCGRSLG